MDDNVIIRSRSPLRISFGGGGTDVPPYPEKYEYTLNIVIKLPEKATQMHHCSGIRVHTL